jgi:SagB-type dehydrogenase family enzyme
VAKLKFPDIADMYHLHSSNLREIPPDMRVDYDRKPKRNRTYPGAKRAVLGGKNLDVATSYGTVLEERRSIREFVDRPLSADLLGRILYISYAIRGYEKIDNEWSGRRCVPSAGGLYPLELYVALQNVESLDDGIYHYDARAHELELRRAGNLQQQLAEMTIGQDMIARANVIIVVAANFHRTMWKYGQRGYRYVWIEAGHVGQNVYLLAPALGLGAVAIGGFFDSEVDQLLMLPPEERSIYLLCVGQTADASR